MKVIIFKILILLSFLAVILVNYLANSLPLNNRSTGEISDSYPSFFTPAGFTFSIWGIIYLLLGILVFKAVITSSDQFFNQYSETFILMFVFTCITNISWLFCWHYDKIGLSLIVMFIFYLALLFMTFYLKDLNYFTKISISTYTGWISVAFITNLAVYLVKLDIPFFQNRETFWFILIMIVGLLIALSILIFTKNIVVVIVFAWAYFGIFMKHYQKYGYYLTKNLNIFNLAMLLIIVGSIIFTLIVNDFKLFSN